MKVVSLLKSKKMTVTWHEVWGKKYWQEYLGPILGYIAYCIELVSAKLPDQIISVSSKTTKDLENVLGVKSGVVTIPNGLDIDFIAMSDKSKNESDVIFAGRLLPNKNVDVLISAINIIKSRGFNLKVNIVGDGPERARLENQVVKLGLGSQVNFLGFVKENSDLYGLIKSSKVFVLPSNREGFGIAVIEANACGIPVITINDEHNAAKDLIVNGKNGEVCGLSDIEIADTIIKVLKNKNDESQYVSYSNKYDWSGLLNKFSEAYQ
jgi:glycosyltransferase involved in cell wall biosynthesis